MLFLPDGLRPIIRSECMRNWRDSRPYKTFLTIVRDTPQTTRTKLIFYDKLEIFDVHALTWTLRVTSHPLVGRFHFWRL